MLERMRKAQEDFDTRKNKEFFDEFSRILPKEKADSVSHLSRGLLHFQWPGLKAPIILLPCPYLLVHLLLHLIDEF